MKISINKNIVAIIFILLIAVITHWQWFFINSYFGWGDAMLMTRFNETWQSFIELPSIWSTLSNGLGEIDLILSQYPIYSTFGMLVRLGIDSRFIAKIVYYFPIAFLTPLGSFILIKHFTKTNLSAFVGSVVYSYNVNILLSQTGSLSISAAFALAPLSVFAFIKALEEWNLRICLLAGLISFLNSMYEFRIFYITTFIILFYAIFYIFFTKNKLKLKTIFISTIPFLIVGILSAYWLLPFIKTKSIQTNPAFSRSLFGDSYMSLNQSLVFFSPWWTAGRGYANGVVQSIPNYFWAIPILALLGFALNYKNPKVYFFLFLSLLGILLTKQSDKPFPNLYLWLYQHFPGFNAYREASKFFVILSLGYSVLIAFFIASLRLRKSIVATIVVLVSLLFLWNAKPFVIGEIGGLFVPKTRPRDFEIIKDFLYQQPDFFRTAWLPASGMWGYFDLTHPKINLHTAYFDTFGPIMSVQNDFISAANESKLIDDINHQALNFFNQNYSDHFLDALSVKYIIIPLEDNQNDDNVFTNYGLNDRSYLVKYLDSLKFLNKINTPAQNMDVYENQNFYPHIYATLKPESLGNVQKTISIEYKVIDPTRYQVKIKNLTEPIYLNFTDTYNFGWDLYLGSFNSLTSGIKKNNVLSQRLHQQNVFTFNSFYLDPKVLSQDLELTLFFSPQSYVYIGSIISLIGGFVLLIFLAIPLHENN